jgi:hypothetical protein
VVEIENVPVIVIDLSPIVISIAEELLAKVRSKAIPAGE